MNELNIAGTLIRKRREKGVTQDELAGFIGVSKASVSKWETGQSYPDIAFLPQLASYFQITVDELIDYRPQLPPDQIRRLYEKLAADFASLPADDVLAHCREIAKKYFSCFPLLYQIGLLLLNHCGLFAGNGAMSAVLSEAKDLFVRVREGCGDPNLMKQAQCMEASCCIALGDADTALELLSAESPDAMPTEVLVAAAHHQLKGDNEKALAVLQVGLYRSVTSLFSAIPSYLAACNNEPERYVIVLRRALAVADAFALDTLHPAMLMTVLLSGAQGYASRGQTEEALPLLERYAAIAATLPSPIRLKTDDFFDKIGGWLEGLDLGSLPPRNEKTIRRSLCDAVGQNPLFASLRENRRFASVLRSLQALQEDAAL